LPEYPLEQLFPSFNSLYKTAKLSFYNFLRNIRKAKVGMARGSRRRGAVSTLTTGRNTRTVQYAEGKSKLAPLKTIINSITNGHYNLKTNKFNITNSDMLGWTLQEYESLTLILLVDVSKSTWPFIKTFKEILRSLTGYFSKHNDRVGLISLQGLQAKTYSHPTHNFRVVARGLTRLKFHGETPIADGLYKSLNMARLERSKNPGSKSIVILLSDCYPEPITPGCINIIDDPAYRNSITAAAQYKKAKTLLLIINPAVDSVEAKLPGEMLAKSMAEASGGRLINLYRSRDERYAKPSKKEIEIIVKGVEDTLFQFNRQRNWTGNQSIVG